MELPELQTERMILRLANVEDIPPVIDYYRRNQNYLQPFSPLAPDNFFTHEFWRAKVEANIDEYYLGIACRFFIFPENDAQHVIGHAGFSQIFRGPFHACYLGYSIDEGCQGKGLMYESLVRAIDFAFNELDLHRIMANYMPRNVRSGKLLRRLGFQSEGYACDYLQINGKWEDHILTSLKNERWKGE